MAMTLSLALGVLVPWQPAYAVDDYAPVLQMLRNGRTADALARADQYLATRPRDPQMQFLRAQALANAGRTADAIAAYRQLTQEYPELAEPHNNLAALYAIQNQLEPARAALEAAIRNNPTYATAHENLGDILLRLAAQSWTRARQLEPGLTSVGPKLAAARGLIEATPPARAATPFSPPASPPSTPSTAPR
jgi:tetratricopeptide (TPR) repeat protein